MEDDIQRKIADLLLVLFHNFALRCNLKQLKLKRAQKADKLGKLLLSLELHYLVHVVFTFLIALLVAAMRRTRLDQQLFLVVNHCYMSTHETE